MLTKLTDMWAARLRDAPAARAAEAILAELLGYRDSHLLHADDVAQLASALEAWGTLVLEGARPDGSPYVPPTEGERASAQASLVARSFVNEELAVAQREHDRARRRELQRARIARGEIPYRDLNDPNYPNVGPDGEAFARGYWERARGSPRPNTSSPVQDGWEACDLERGDTLPQHTGAPDA